MNTFQVECLIYILVLILLTLFAVKEIRDIAYDLCICFMDGLINILKSTILYIRLFIRSIRRFCCLTPHKIHNPLESYNVPNQERLIQLNPLNLQDPSYDEL